MRQLDEEQALDSLESAGHARSALAPRSGLGYNSIHMSRRFLKGTLHTFVAFITLSAAAQTAAPDPKPEAKRPDSTVDGKPPEKPSDYSQEGFIYEVYRTAARFEADGTGVREYSARV